MLLKAMNKSQPAVQDIAADVVGDPVAGGEGAALVAGGAAQSMFIRTVFMRSKTEREVSFRLMVWKWRTSTRERCDDS